jgi:limonene-1,2-epoxide hydrolase
MGENERRVRDFIAAWSRLDAKELVDYFTEDGIYHNMPARPVQGRANLLPFIAGFIGTWTRTEWKILNLLAAGDLVIVERLDCTRLGDRAVDLPCCGVFEMQQGRIRVWRDYFDMNTYVKAIGG